MDNCKDDKVTIRINQEIKHVWNLYALKIGYNHLAEFIRDCVNGIINAKIKPKKVIEFLVCTEEDNKYKNGNIYK